MVVNEGWAQPGSLDATFVPTPPGLDQLASTLAVQPDGKILVGGVFTQYNAAPRKYIARLNADGTLDGTFTTGVSGFDLSVNVLAVQTDGKIVVGGNFSDYNGTIRNYVARLNADGTLDGSFVPAGTGLDNVVYALAIQTDGKILVGGNFTHYNGTMRNYVARLNTNGSLDGSFAPTPPGLDNNVFTIAVQTDGKILVGGSFTNYNGTARNSIARLNADGTLDATFTTGVSGFNLSVSTIAIQPDGKILVGGDFTDYNGTSRNYIARLNANGTLDGTFVVGSGFDVAVSAIVVQPDGKILVGGLFTTYNSMTRNRITRLNADGTLDMTFTQTGTGLDNNVNTLALQADGNIVVGGSFTNYDVTARNYVARLTGGAPSPTYTWNGLINTDYQNPNNWTPARTTPLPTDDIIFDPPTSTVHVVTNIPSQTVNNLTINNTGAPGNIVRFQSSPSRTLTVNGSFNNSGRIEMGDVTQLSELSAITIVLRGATNTQPITGAITLGKQASLRLENGAALTINGVMRTSRADGINGTSALAGAFQLGTGGGTLTYGAVGTCSFVGYGNQTANVAAVAGKPAISSIAGDIQIDKPGGTAAATAEVTINSNITIQGFNWGSFPNRSCFIPLGVTVTTTLPDTWTGTIKVRIAGQFINGMGVTVSGGGEIEMIGTAGWSGPVPTFNANTSLRYTGAGDVMTSIVPTTMNGKLYVQKSSGDLAITGPPQTFNDSVVVASRLVFPVNSVALGAGGQVEIQSGGTLRFAGAAASLTASMPINRVVVRNGGTLERVAGAGTVGSPNPTLVYDVGSTLLYSGTGNITTGTELPLFPAPIISNLNVNNAGTLTCSSALTLEGTSTIGTASVMRLVGPTFFSGPLTLNGIIKIPVASNNLLFGGPLLLNGSIDATGVSPSVQMQFIGSGSVTGTLGFIGNTYNGRIFLNRPGMRLVLGSSLNFGGITFTQGVLVVNPPNLLTLTDVSVIGILGGNAHSYVDGMLARNLPRNQTIPDTWLFPVGKNGRYLPVSIVSPKTGGNAPLVQAEAFTGATGGRADSTLNSLLSGTYWNVNLVSGDILSTRIRLESDAPTIPLNAVVAKSPTLTGAYTSIGRDSVSATRIVSAPFTGFSTFTLGTPFVPPPPTVAITSFSPLSGTSGTTVIINGANFNTVTGVFFGGVPVQSFTVDSASQIRAIVGNGASGAVTVRTSSFSSATTATQFTFIGAPTITSIQPPIVGLNQDIVITGTNFFTTTNASLGASLLVSLGNGTASSVVVNSPTQITVRFQAITSGTLTVRAQGGTVTSSQMLSVVPPPTIIGFSPSVVAQNSILTVTGANFIQNQTQVRLNGFVLPATVNSPTRASVQLPANAQTGMLTFTTPGGTTTSNQQLTVVQPPTISAVQTTSGVAGTPFTITGQNLALSGVLLVGGIPTAFTLNTSGTVLTALVPALPNDVQSSQASIRFSTLGGTATFGQSLTILPPAQPTITSIEPNPIVEGGTAILRLAGTTATTIIGEVSIGGILAEAIVQPDGSLRFIVPSGVVSSSATQQPVFVTLTTTQNGRTSSTTAALALTVQAANIPAITGFSPQTGSSTTTLTITGQNFGIAPRGSIQAVLVGGVPVQSFRIISPNLIQVTLGTVPSGAITVQTSSGALSTSGTFIFDPRSVFYVPVSAQDSTALTALYRAAGGANWTNNTNWLADNVSTWFGVVLANGRVSELRLPTNGLRGSLSPAAVEALRALSGLRVLDWSGNAISGDVSALFPALTALESLNLSNTTLFGTLANICSLAHLRELNLANCRFEGTLEGLCCLNRVEMLNVSNNLFSGTIPACFGEKPTLVVFDASNNQLSGELPPTLGAPETLQVLNLRGNRLTGSIPASWGAPAGKVRASAQALTGLQRLDLAQNQLSGALPPELGGLRNLRELSLAGNRFSGAIPASFQDLIRLRVLDVSNNQFSAAPNFTLINRLDTLAMQNNLFDFATLEQQLIPSQAASTRAFLYSPQKTVLAITGATTAVLDSELTLTINARGSQNTYRWRLDSNILSGATSASLVNARCTAEIAGKYGVEVRSTLLPELILPTQPFTVLVVQPAAAPQELVRLLEPSANAIDVSPVPNFAWSSVRGAGVYRFELAGAQDFTNILATTAVEQSAEILAAVRVARSGQMLAGAGVSVMPFPLSPLTQYFWRVRAENVRGSGAFASGSFTTAGRDVVLGGDKVEFGTIARLDTGVGVFTVRNITAAPVRLIAIASTNPAFVFDAVQNLVVPVGGSVRVAVRFLPQTLIPQEADVRLSFAIGTSTNAQTQVLTSRLTGSASGLKVIPPRFDTVLAGQTRMASAQVINRGDRTALLKNLSIDARGREYAFVFDRDKSGLAVGANDTIAVPLRVRALQTGRLPTGLMRYEAEFEGNPNATPPVPVRNEVVNVALNVFARPRTGNEPTAQVGVRVKESEKAHGIAPGAIVTLEVFLAGGNRTELVKNTSLLVSGTLRYDRNVLVLTEQERSIWRIRNTAAQNRFERLALAPTRWDGRSEVLATIRCRAVAGDVDTTVIELENIVWDGAELEEFVPDVLHLNVCKAGGKRLVTTAQRTQLTVIAPNPAKEQITLAYTLREDGFVEIALIDASGKTAHILVSEEQAAGEHTLTSALKNVPSGSYMVRLSTQNGVVTKRLSVVR